MAIAIKTLDEIESIVNAQTGWIFPHVVAATVDCTQDSARDHLSRLAKKGRIARQWVKLGKQSRYCYAKLGAPPPTDLSLPPRTFMHEPKVVAFRPNEPGVWKYLRTVTSQMEDGETVGEVELILIETQIGNAAACDKSREQSTLLARCRKLADEQRQALVMERVAAARRPERSAGRASPLPSMLVAGR